MKFLQDPTKILFFTGKGGVGKTTIACATAINFADRGEKVLLVCTDPASNLDDVLDTQIGSAPVLVNGVTNLLALNINPEEAARQYREKIIGPYRGVLPDVAINSMEEQLSGACTTEIAAFDEFAKILGEEETTAQYDRIIFDTAPTGHTLRLLQLPSAWDGFLDNNTTGTSCLGPLSGLQDQHQLYKKTSQALQNPTISTIILVCRPDKASLTEASRTSKELAELQIDNQQVVVNGFFSTEDSDEQDPIATKLAKKHQKALADCPQDLVQFSQDTLPLLPFAPLGSANLRLVLSNEQSISHQAQAQTQTLPMPPDFSKLCEQLSAAQHGVIMTMGKGGVGKTTIATKIALSIAQKGYKVHLATTDPASHLDSSLTKQYPHLEVSSIDPKQETKAYSQKVMREAGATLDEDGKKLLEEDLRSPCTEEIAVFQAFARLLEQGTSQFVVIDTAPTGHTLLLLDAAQSYHKEVSKKTDQLPDMINSLLPRLRNQNFTKIIITTLPETTPIHEASQLVDDLKRAQINPFCWVVNQSLLPLSLSNPLLLTRQQQEVQLINNVVARSAPTPFFLEAWHPDQK